MRFIFFYIATLNLLDGAITYLGLHLNIITEANPFMAAIYDAGPHWFLLVKIVLSALLYGLNLTGFVPEGKGIRRLAIFAVILYTVVCILHSFWIIAYML